MLRKSGMPLSVKRRRRRKTRYNRSHPPIAAVVGSVPLLCSLLFAMGASLGQFPGQPAHQVLVCRAKVKPVQFFRPSPAQAGVHPHAGVALADAAGVKRKGDLFFRVGVGGLLIQWAQLHLNAQLLPAFPPGAVRRAFPGSTFPPGNSHRLPQLPPGPRRQISTFSSRRRITAATCSMDSSSF